MESKKKRGRFQWDACDYAKHSGAQHKWAKELISKLNLKNDEYLLDIGCGDGKVTAEIASYLSNGLVVGIDNSEEMIALARARFPSSKYFNLSFCIQDARELSFHQEFDVLFSNAVLHWVIDHRPVLKGMYRALKTNGRIVVQMGGKGNAFQVVEAVNNIIAEPEWEKYFRGFSFPYAFYSPEEYRPWLEGAGFLVRSLELNPKEMIHETIHEFKGWFRTTWLPYIQRVPVRLKERFINVSTEKYLQSNPPDKDGRIITRMQRLEYIAIKK